MFRIGPQLYDLNAKDLEGIPIEPYLRTLSASLGAGLSTGQGDLDDWPIDRMLYVRRIVVVANNSLDAASTWTLLTLTVRDRVFPLANPVLLWATNVQAGDAAIGDYKAAAGNQVAFNLDVDFILPARTRLSLVGTRSVNTNAAAVQAFIHGYTIPVGSVARGIV